MNKSDSLIKTMFVVLLVILIAPLGILLMWFWTQWPKWLKIFLTFWLIILPFVVLPILYIFLLQPFKVSGPSMQPTLLSGDYIMIEKFSFQKSDPQRGDIVVYQNLEDNTDYLGRIIGLPRDNVSYIEDEVFINGQKLGEPYLPKDTKTKATLFMGNSPDVTVPQNSYYILGDNRDHSSDSRVKGFVKGKDIIGKYWISYYQAPR